MFGHDYSGPVLMYLGLVWIKCLSPQVLTFRLRQLISSFSPQPLASCLVKGIKVRHVIKMLCIGSGLGPQRPWDFFPRKKKSSPPLLTEVPSVMNVSFLS